MGFIDKIKDKSNVVYDVHDKRLRPVTALDSGKIVGVNQDGEFEVREVPASQTMTEITMQELYNLKQSSELIPGMWYRITDYAPTYSGANYTMAGHQFDIIVLATNINSIASQCFFDKHTGDTYFANNDLSKWKGEFVLEQIEIDLTVTGTHNHYGNDFKITSCVYDSSGDMTIDGIYYYCITSWDFNGPGVSIGTRYVTAGVNKVFEYLNNEMIEDTAFTITSVVAPELLAYGYINKLIDEFNNECPYDFKNVKYNSVSYLDHTYTNAYTFSNYGSGIYDSTLDASLDNSVRNNKMIYKSSITNLPQNVFFGNNCYNNVFGDYCNNNIFGINCFNNIFSDSCVSNTFGNGCSNNAFDDYCQGNTFSNYCNSNIFGDFCMSNIFGNNCEHNTFGDNCNSNIFGNHCEHNTFGSMCSSNIFGDSNSTINYVQYITLDVLCRYLEILSDDTDASFNNYLQNVHIHSGVQGTSEAKLTISVPDRNLAYSIGYYAAGSQEIVFGGGGSN